MGGAVHPLTQYAFMEWCSVGRSTDESVLLSKRRINPCVVHIIPMYYIVIMHVSEVIGIAQSAK
jgi:hypothetical protein